VVYPYNNTSFRGSELGASIFVDANVNLVRAAYTFGLEVESFKDDMEQIGIWDGSNIVVTVCPSAFASSHMLIFDRLGHKAISARFGRT
jgi:hypothetical protein